MSRVRDELLELVASWTHFSSRVKYPSVVHELPAPRDSDRPPHQGIGKRIGGRWPDTRVRIMHSYLERLARRDPDVLESQLGLSCNRPEASPPGSDRDPDQRVPTIRPRSSFRRPEHLHASTTQSSLEGHALPSSALRQSRIVPRIHRIHRAIRVRELLHVGRRRLRLLYRLFQCLLCLRLRFLVNSR